MFAVGTQLRKTLINNLQVPDSEPEDGMPVDALPITGKSTVTSP